MANVVLHKNEIQSCFLKIELLGSAICVIGCHLAAHENKLKKRIKNIQEVWNEISFRQNTLSIEEHDIIFWCGDMNFRVEKLSFEEAKSLIWQKKYTELAQFDQLNANKHICFPGFKEHELNYPPTFKFLTNSDSQ